MYPLEQKVKILTRIRPVARFLFGKLNNEYTDSQRKHESKQLLEYCKSISAPEISSWDDIKTKFGRWKQNLSNKIERRKKTGAPRADNFDEAELIISAIINENPCLQKTEVLGLIS